MKRKSIILTLILSVLCSQTVLAATWMQNDTGWWWQEDDGSYPVSSWKLINGHWYYFHSSGYMAENTWIGDYYVGNDGAMLVNTVTPDGYRVGADGAWIRETGNSSGVVTREKAYEAVDKYVRDHSNAVDWTNSMDGNTLVVAVKWRTGIFTHICVDLDTGECVEKGPYISRDGMEHWDLPLTTEYLFNVNEQTAKEEIGKPAVNYSAYVTVLEDRGADEFALIDVENDGVSELFVRKDGSGIRCDWSIYTIRNQRAVRVAADTIGWDFAVCPGLPYVATHVAGYESWFSKLYNAGDSYKLTMEVSYGESDEEDNWGDKDTYTYIVTSGSLLHFVDNTYANRSGYAAAGISTGFDGAPDTTGSYYSNWLYNNLR